MATIRFKFHGKGDRFPLAPVEKRKARVGEVAWGRHHKPVGPVLDPTA
jgi:hypothetical protein